MTMLHDADVLVIGSGAGGATFAYACAAAGRRVLLVERGNKYLVPDRAQDERAMLIDKKPYDDRVITLNGRPRRLYVGGVFGGSTALYGAALLRPSPEDFHPGKYYGGRIPRATWDWPITYDELEPYYTEAETLYGTAGSYDQDFGPLPGPRRGYPRPAIPVKPINQQLVTANRARGLRPFRLPLAIDFDRCRQCDACPGYICPNGARRSSAQVVEKARAQDAPLEVLLNVEAERLDRDGAGRVAGVWLCDRLTGRRTLYRAQCYALAAGAIGSPALLLRSGMDAPHVGRHYMFHLSPVVAGVFPHPTGADATFIKQIGFADFYFGTRDYAHKLGIIQSLPVPGPLLLAKTAPRWLPRGVLRSLRRRMLPLAGIVEDLPNPANRVTLRKDGGVELRHAFAPYDVERGHKLQKLMNKILKRAGAWFCLNKPFASDEHVAHQCGTLRFGRRPADAVADPDGRLFGHPNVFVVDGSIFPTSLGVGPALTIMANALRVARLVTREI